MIKIKITKDVCSHNLPKDVLKLVKKDLRFYNPIWVENEKMGRWNRGTPKFIDMFTEVNGRFGMPSAYIEDLIRILERKDLEYNIHDLRKKNPVNFAFSGDLRSYQSFACSEVLFHDTGTLVAPTGSGKTVMGIHIIAERKERTLILVHTKELAFQWIERISQFLNIDEKEIGLLGAGKKKEGDRVQIALVQSIFRNPGFFPADAFGFVIVDECHRVPSRTFREAITQFKPYYSLGLTATAFRRDKLDKLIFYSVGPIRHEIPKDKLEEQGAILKARVIMRETQFEPSYDAVAEYSQMLSELTRDKKRNQLICSDIASYSNSDDICLILSDRKAHCELLRDLLEAYGIKAQVLHGSISQKKRKDIIANIGQRGYRYIIATGQLIGEGFDCKELNVMFITTPIKFSGRLIQYVGRVLRPAKNKEIAVIHDYVDWYVEVLERAAYSRIKVYGKENIFHE